MPDPAQTPSPPRAFTQGVGTVYQFVGGSLFIALSLLCCLSSLLSKDFAERRDLAAIGWHLPSDAPDQPFYSAQRAISTWLFVGITLTLSVAAVGLGLQATRRKSPGLALLVAGAGLLFWISQILFAWQHLRSVVPMLVTMAGAVLFALLLVLAVGAWRDMRITPPPPGHEVLAPDAKIPYSWYHEDPPEVRLERELAQRRQRLALQQKELEMLEEKLRRARDDRDSAE